MVEKQGADCQVELLATADATGEELTVTITRELREKLGDYKKQLLFCDFLSIIIVGEWTTFHWCG